MSKNVLSKYTKDEILNAIETSATILHGDGLQSFAS
jgi:hypothetical protein